MGLALYKSFQNVLATSTEQIIRINTGFLGSLNAIHSFIRPPSGTVDSGVTQTRNVANYYIQLDSQRYPRNKLIGCGGTGDPELLYQLLASSGNV